MRAFVSSTVVGVAAAAAIVATAGPAEAILVPSPTFTTQYTLVKQTSNPDSRLTGMVTNRSNLPAECRYFVFAGAAIDATQRQATADNDAYAANSSVPDLSPELQGQILSSQTTGTIDPAVVNGFFPPQLIPQQTLSILTRCTLSTDGEGPAQGRSYAEQVVAKRQDTSVLGQLESGSGLPVGPAD